MTCSHARPPGACDAGAEAEVVAGSHTRPPGFFHVTFFDQDVFQHEENGTEENNLNIFGQAPDEDSAASYGARPARLEVDQAKVASRSFQGEYARICGRDTAEQIARALSTVCSGVPALIKSDVARHLFGAPADACAWMARAGHDVARRPFYGLDVLRHPAGCELTAVAPPEG